MLRAVLRDSLVYTLPLILTRGMGLLLLPVYGRFLSRPDFGMLDLVLAAGPVVSVLVALEVQQGLSRLRVEASDDEKRRMTGTTWLFTAAGYALFLTVVLLAATPLSEALLGDERYSGPLRVAAASLAAGGLFTTVANQLRWELRSRTYAALTSGYAALTVTLTLLLTVVVDGGLTGVLAAQTVAGAAGTVAAVVLLRGSWVATLDSAQLRRMLTFSLPLIPASLSVFMTLYFNRVALAYFGDLNDVATYGMAARVAGLVGLLIVGMQSAVTPLLYKHYREPTTPTQLARLFSAVVGLCFVLCTGLAVCSADLLTIIGGDRYSSSAGLVPLVAPALLLGQLYVFAPGMALAMRTKAQLGVALLAAVVDVVANVALIPCQGALGAAISTVVSSSVFLLVWVLASQRTYPVPFEVRRLMLGVVLFVLGVVIADVVREVTDPLSPAGLLFKALVVAVASAGWWALGLFRGIVEAVRRPVSHPAGSR